MLRKSTSQYSLVICNMKFCMNNRSQAGRGLLSDNSWIGDTRIMLVEAMHKSALRAEVLLQ